MISRRSLLAGLGGAATVAVGGGALFAFTRTPEAALAPWTAPGEGVDDPRIRALEWAVLAPSAHNRQPWLVELKGRDEAVLHCDLDRGLPATDPFDRQVLIGLGAFLELYEMAARADGHGVATVLFPEGVAAPGARLDERPVARILLTSGGGPADPLFSAAPLRRTSREPFDPDRAVTPEAVERVAFAARTVRVDGVFGGELVPALRDICRRGWTVEARTPHVYRESVDVMRIGRREIEANPDGIAISGAVVEALAFAGLLTRESLADPSSTAFRTGFDGYLAAIDSAPAFLWCATAGNTRADQVAAGRDWMRLTLAAAAEGLSVHPLSQVLQEFPEMEGLFGETHAALEIAPPARVQMLARIGYGPGVAPSPRWPARSRLL